MKKKIACINMILDTETNEMDINLNIDFTEEENINQFKKIILKFAQDVQSVSMDDFKISHENNMMEHVKKLLSSLESEETLDNIVSGSAQLAREAKICEGRKNDE